MSSKVTATKQREGKTEPSQFVVIKPETNIYFAIKKVPRKELKSISVSQNFPSESASLINYPF